MGFFALIGGQGYQTVVCQKTFVANHRVRHIGRDKITKRLNKLLMMLV